MIKFVIDFPVNITITSSGPAAEKYPYLMGDYKMIITTVQCGGNRFGRRQSEITIFFTMV